MTPVPTPPVAGIAHTDKWTDESGQEHTNTQWMKKGVAKGIIEEKLDESDRNDEAEIRKIIARKRARYDDEKLIAYLCRQGFPYDLVREIVLTPEKD